MTPDELSKEAERLRDYANDRSREDGNKEILNTLRAVHDAAIEEAAETSKQAVLEHDNRMLAQGVGWNLDAEQTFIGDAIRALKLGDGK